MLCLSLYRQSFASYDQKRSGCIIVVTQRNIIVTQRNIIVTQRNFTVTQRNIIVTQQNTVVTCGTQV